MADDLDTVQDAPATEAPVAEKPTENTEGPSLRDALMQAYDKAEKTSDTPETPAEAAQRARDEKGRFATKSADKPTSEAATAPQASPAASEAPQSWSAEAKAHFATLPPALKQQVADWDAQATQAASKAQAYDAIDRVIGPRRDQFAATYGSVEQGLQTVFNTLDWAQRDPAGFARWFAQSARLTPQHLFPAGQQQQPQVDPQLAPVHQRLAAVDQRIQAFERQQQAQQVAQIGQTVEAFAEGKPHFSKVEGEMARLITAGLASNLQEAYDKAIRLDATVWEAIQAEKSAADVQAAKERAAKATRANAINVTSRGTSGTQPAARSLRDSLAASYEEARNRAA